MDKPVTDAELDQFYGVEPSEMQIAITIGESACEVDADVMACIAYECFHGIADVIESPEAVGKIIIEARKQWIADVASKAIYGRVGVIKSSEVKA